MDLWKNRLLREQYYFCWKYVKFLRIVEYYHNSKNIFHKIMYVMWRFKKNRLGIRLGLELWDNCFDEGIKIFHSAGIIVNANAKIGKNCVLHGNNCIGNNGITNEAPVLGNDVEIGVGAKIIGPVFIADGTKIGANAVVVKSCYEPNSTIIGVPTHKVGS